MDLKQKKQFINYFRAITIQKQKPLTNYVCLRLRNIREESICNRTRYFVESNDAATPTMANCKLTFFSTSKTVECSY